MPETLPFFVYDVFTVQPYTGNPLAIVEQAEGLSTAQMQTMARQFNLSETIFVMPPRDAGHRARVRIFFPTAEIPFAGHPTLGCAVHLTRAEFDAGASQVEIVLEEEAGLVPVTLTRQADGSVEGWFSAPVLPEVAGGTVLAEALPAALGLDPEDVGLPGHSPAIWQGGPSFGYVPLASLEALSRAQPTGPAWDEVCAAAGIESFYLYTPGANTDWQARMYAPAHGIAEDPATGSATALFAAQLLEAGALDDGETQLSLAQGVEMGRPSRLGLAVTVRSGALVEIRVGGSAVPVSSGQITPPA